MALDFKKTAAIGIGYDGSVPMVVRKSAFGAEQSVLSEAIRYGIPVVQDGLLAEALAGVSLLDQVPEEYFGPIALQLVRLRLV